MLLAPFVLHGSCFVTLQTAARLSVITSGTSTVSDNQEEPFMETTA